MVRGFAVAGASRGGGFVFRTCLWIFLVCSMPGAVEIQSESNWDSVGVQSESSWDPVVNSNREFAPY